MLNSIVRTVLSTSIGLGALLATAGAEPLGTAFTYQGDLRFQGAPANGAFDFRFSLYADADGFMLVAGPLEIEDLTVTEGIFTASLDFGVMPFGGDALWLEVSVREGASTAGFAQLLPRQKITATPYSLHAEMVAANAVSSVEIADASITSADIAGNAVTSAKIAPGAVGGAEVDSAQVQLRVAGTCAQGESVRTIKADGTVTCEADDDTTYSGTDFALSEQSCVAGQVVEGVNADGTVSCSAEVQLRISGGCSVGQSIRSIAADGTVTCGFGQFFSSRPTFALTVDDPANNVGSYTSIAIAPDGLPVISYYDFSARALKVAKCNDTACSGSDEILTTVDDPANDVGRYTSIAIAPDGLPVISYYDQSAGTLKVAKCNDPACSGNDEDLSIVDHPTSNVGWDTSIAIVPDGLPVISYYDFSAGALKVAKCGNLECS